MKRITRFAKNVLAGTFCAALICTGGAAMANAGTVPVSAANTAEQTVMLPEANLNLNRQLLSNSYLVTTSDGYMRLFYDQKEIKLEYMDSNLNLLSRKTIAMELEIWGGFYEGKDAYYLVEGQNNTECVDNTEVVRIIKYDKKWNRLGSGSIYSENNWFYKIRYPFDYGRVSMTEYNGVLYIATGREGYVDTSIGQGHQGMVLISMNESTMQTDIIAGNFGHSFAQFLDHDGKDLYLLERSEGSRATTLKKFDAETGGSSGTLSLLDYGGSRTSVWAITTYSSVDDLAISKNNILGTGISIKNIEENYDNLPSDASNNIYLTITPKSDFSESASQVKWLTDYEHDSHCFSGLNITKVNDNRFLVTWGEYLSNEEAQNVSTDDFLEQFSLHYVFIDENGNKISQEFTEKASISQCHPIVRNDQAVFYSSSANTVDYYTINTKTGVFSKKVYRCAGDNVTWSVQGDTLTFSGSGKININTGSYSVYSEPYTGFGPSRGYPVLPWGPKANQIKNIVVDNGVTGIGDGALNGLRYTKSIQLPDSLQTIGKKVFSVNYYMTEINIPKNVTYIDETTFSTLVYLEKINVDSENGTFSSLNGLLFNKSQTKLIFCPVEFSGVCSVPAKTENINLSALTAVRRLSEISVDANNKVYSSAEGVLFNKDKTELLVYPGYKTNDSYIIPGSVKKIADRAFASTIVKNVTIPGSVTTIGSEAFLSNDLITKVTIEQGASDRTIGYSAFSGCFKLFSVTIPEGVTELGGSVFFNCRSLTEINLPASMKKLSTSDFNAQNLRRITVASGNKNYSATDGVLYNKDKTRLIFCPRKKGGSVVIPAGIKNIENNTAQSMDILQNVVITGGTETLERYSFSYCKGLETLYIGDGLQTIKEYVCYDCTSLKYVTIPSSVTSIGYASFNGCSQLTIVGVKGSYAEQFANEHNIPFQTTLPAYQNKSAVSKNSVPQNTNVTVKGSVCGGKGGYKYAFYYKKSTSSAWQSLGEIYGDTTEVTFVPASVATYQVKVNVKDLSGKVLTKMFEVTSTKPTGNDLINTSSMEDNYFVKNNYSKILGSASGGSGSYTYSYYYKKSTSKSFTPISENTSKTNCWFCPATAGKYQVRVNVEDSSGTVVTRQITIDVSSGAPVKNNSMISNYTIDKGGIIYFWTLAENGKEPYSFSAYYKKSTSKAWTTIGTNYKNEGNGYFSVATKGTYYLKIVAQDSEGSKAEKIFTITSQ